ncbi:MAG: hypothetical protein WEE64_16090 [Dehalococcoidia bacterium]
MKPLRGWDIVEFGRMAGFAIIAIGFGVAAWEAIDLNGEDSGIEGSQIFRGFLTSVLAWLQTGALVILVAEIASRLGVAGQEEGVLDEGESADTESAGEPPEVN